MLLYARPDSRGFHIATKWFLRGWEPMPYQYTWHHIQQKNATWVGGIATAKTTANAASNLMMCASIPYFKALNTAMTAKQAELPFEMITSWVEGNHRLEQLVEDVTLKPYPIIKFKSLGQYEFRTAGTDARFIRGFEYDRIGFDECALDHVGNIVKVLRGRLRGTRANQEKRLARLDTTSSPATTMWFKERYEKAEKMPHLYFSMRTATWENTHLTKMQIEAMMAEMPPEMVDVELGGMWPNYGFSMIPLSHIEACVDQTMYDAAYIATNPEDPAKIPEPGFELLEDARHGIVKFEFPYIPGHRYVVAGDPGVGNYPDRNAGSVMVRDITKIPHKIVYSNWISGNGSIMPFLQSLKYAIDKYRPELKGIDATGTQAYMEELAFQNAGISIERINFGSDKDGALNALAYDIVNHHLKYPPIQGLVRQLGMYSRELDTQKKIAQDLVMCLAQTSFLSRMVHENADTTVYQAKPKIGRHRIVNGIRRMS